jgi:hypothetical protein
VVQRISLRVGISARENKLRRALEFERLQHDVAADQINQLW